MKVDFSAGKTIKYMAEYVFFFLFFFVLFFCSCCLVLFIAPALNVSPEEREWDPEKRFIIGFFGVRTFVYKNKR